MIRIMKPGLLTSIQDLGRYGYQKYGVISSGVMDQLAHRIANLLVGNSENEATLELTLIGPALRFERDTLISICGADLSPAIDGIPVQLWKTIYIKSGSLLTFGRNQSGCRAYIAAAGGFSVPDVMGSKSTYLRAGIGGFEGRSLNTGDEVLFGMQSSLSAKMMDYLRKQQTDQPFSQLDWSVSSGLISFYKSNTKIRIIKGRQFDWFTKDSQKAFFSVPFQVTPQSDRMGYRLNGSKLEVENKAEMISEAVSFGTVQVPSNGSPIVLMADRQTTGGYPKIGQVPAVDLPLLAQAKPGDSLAFEEIPLEAAQNLYLKREQEIQHLKQGIILKFTS
ncbi:biotin-dependent carboxyltransferase family protein [Peribacillus deserti]|uniref:KipI antagonist n=1 Tax=Peribacillus deserti TaxID=673318 RepID=A0A2N5M8T6_9BACI|nr:biotin-dependent carboxyltransferase family protein [Peribacillus deserti]PLT30757.1 KipI antagonist [Peribacillus deserti]